MMELSKKEIALLKVAVASYGLRTIEAMEDAEAAEDWISHEDLAELDDDLAVLFEKLRAATGEKETSGMFFAGFKGDDTMEIAMFQTEAERDAWVNFKDEFSLTFGATADNCTFDREAITGTDAEKLAKLINACKDTLTFIPDAYVDGLTWVQFIVYGGARE